MGATTRAAFRTITIEGLSGAHGGEGTVSPLRVFNHRFDDRGWRVDEWHDPISRDSAIRYNDPNGGAATTYMDGGVARVELTGRNGFYTIDQTSPPTREDDVGEYQSLGWNFGVGNRGETPREWVDDYSAGYTSRDGTQYSPDQLRDISATFSKEEKDGYAIALGENVDPAAFPDVPVPQDDIVYQAIETGTADRPHPAVAFDDAKWEPPRDDN
jgi:hypothetical protein